MSIILASKSPRRKELLSMLGLEFKVLAPETAEALSETAPPEDEVIRVSREKAGDAAKKAGSADLIIAADTLVVLDGRFMGKPKNKTEAAAMLGALSGKRHTVYTGVTLSREDKVISRAEKTDVYFRALTSAEIAAYIATGEPMDKAGAYGAQGMGAVFIRRIEGDFFNVMGLPLCALYGMLAEYGVHILK